jgi:DNA-binding transcriptional ArsR family regulator
VHTICKDCGAYNLAPHPPTGAIVLSSVLRALADPIRLDVLFILTAEGEQTCGMLAERLRMPISTLSNHLKTMREAGVLHSRRDSTLRWATVRADDLDSLFPGLLSSIIGRSASPGTNRAPRAGPRR